MSKPDVSLAPIVQLSVSVVEGSVHIHLPEGVRVVTDTYDMFTRVIAALQEARAKNVEEWLSQKLGT